MAALTRIDRIARMLLRGWILLALMGIVLLGAKAVNTGQHVWQPLQFPLPLEPGRRASGTLLAELDQVYEVALEFDAVMPEEQLRALLSVAGDQAAVDATWTVTANGAVAASGTSGLHLYTTSGGRTLLGRIRRWVLSVPFHR